MENSGKLQRHEKKILQNIMSETQKRRSVYRLIKDAEKIAIAWGSCKLQSGKPHFISYEKNCQREIPATEPDGLDDSMEAH